MPKQKGPVYITGTVNETCFYKMDGQYYSRRKSTLSGKRVKKDPAFALTRVYANLMAQASKLSAAVYRQLPKTQRKLALYRAMTGEALQQLKKGVAAATITAQLQAYCGVKPEADIPAAAPVQTLPETTAGNINRRLRSADINKTSGITYHPSLHNIHLELPPNLQMCVTAEGCLEVRLTNKRTKAARGNIL